jgi:hypothetical protein
VEPRRFSTGERQPGGVTQRGDVAAGGRRPVAHVRYQPRSKVETLNTPVPVDHKTALRDSLGGVEQRTVNSRRRVSRPRCLAVDSRLVSKDVLKITNCAPPRPSALEVGLGVPAVNRWSARRCAAVHPASRLSPDSRRLARRPLAGFGARGGSRVHRVVAHLSVPPVRTVRRWLGNIEGGPRHVK